MAGEAARAALEAKAARLRAALAGLPGISEKRMFGGLCFLLDGNMLVGLHGEKLGGGAMFRVGREGEAGALALPGTRVMEMAGRRMAGYVDLDAAGLEAPETLRRLLSAAIAFVGTLPPKP